MIKKLIVAAIVMLFLIILGVMTLNGVASNDDAQQGESSKAKQPPTVEIIEAATSSISKSLEVTGSVEPYRIARLASPAEGPVLDIRVREGELVKSNEPLLSIGRKSGVDALIVSMREELKKEEEDLRRARKLIQDGVIPEEQLDQARADYEKARAQLVQAEETARDYTIHAPWDGVVTKLLVKEGEFVAPRAVLLEMYDPSSLVIRAAIPESRAADTTADMRVEVLLDAYPQSKFQGRVGRIYPYLDAQLRTRTVEIVLDKPVNLLPGMFARLKMLLHTADNAVVLPLEAVVQSPKGQVVFILEEGCAVRRPVEIGIEEGNRVQVVSGVKPGDKVISAGNGKLKNGAAVRLAGSGGPAPGMGQGKDKGKGQGKGKMAGKAEDGNSTRHAADVSPAAGVSQ
ncbi:hypothetical protein DPQ33_18025 [Oceanidesulfovibrio indonesiensis]|uniref:Efflux RND transporter periplasmic adaptor subunit n=1 Tax=Oceanidesulfovibrio indonesiensis TaxID=54767 RepID=A0A7M3MAC8_9BACT|nr:efflux RND transporter periplasmic adaptor subunit [Oceanidesulfovibrio indonesiensis]TVM13869.1 hypothetical protein DPQ33_18025 [Oceanidesulfovibrio indonesiensis]